MESAGSQETFRPRAPTPSTPVTFPPPPPNPFLSAPSPQTPAPPPPAAPPAVSSHHRTASPPISTRRRPPDPSPPPPATRSVVRRPRLRHRPQPRRPHPPGLLPWPLGSPRGSCRKGGCLQPLTDLSQVASAIQVHLLPL